MTPEQSVIIKDVLKDWLQNEAEVINDSFNYGFSPRDVLRLADRMRVVALLLEEQFGEKDMVKHCVPTAKELEEIIETLKHDEEDEDED